MAIIGVNRIVARPVVLNDTVQVRQMMNLSSSFDHRVVDGAVGAQVLAAFKGLIETPVMMLA